MTSITQKQDICHLKNSCGRSKMKAVGSEVYALEAERMSINGDHYSQIAILITTTLSMERGLFYWVDQPNEF